MRGRPPHIQEMTALNSTADRRAADEKVGVVGVLLASATVKRSIGPACGQTGSARGACSSLPWFLARRMLRAAPLAWLGGRQASRVSLAGSFGSIVVYFARSSTCALSL